MIPTPESPIIEIEEAKKWQALYLTTLKQVDSKEDSALQTGYQYLVNLANHPDTDPVDTYTMASLLQEYPQLVLTVSVPIENGKLALPMNLCVRRRELELEIARYSGTDLVATAKTLKEKADRVVRLLTKKSLEEISLQDFEKLQPLPVRPKTEEDHARTVWWGKVIPNVVAGRELKDIALKRAPSLASLAVDR